jgi:hypothetical protein
MSDNPGDNLAVPPKEGTEENWQVQSAKRRLVPQFTLAPQLALPSDKKSSTAPEIKKKGESSYIISS